MKNEYLIMKDSVNLDSNGLLLPDVMTLDLFEFKYTKASSRYKLTEKDIYRFDQFILSFYGEVSYYQSMVLLLNDIPFLTTDYIGQYIFLPDKSDLDNFYLEQI